MAASWMAAPWLLLEWLITLNKSRNDGYFADFEQVKNLPYTKTPKLDTWITFWATYPCRQHSTLACQTCEGLHQLWDLPRLLSFAHFFFIVQVSSFFIHLPFPNTVN